MVKSSFPPFISKGRHLTLLLLLYKYIHIKRQAVQAAPPLTLASPCFLHPLLPPPLLPTAEMEAPEDAFASNSSDSISNGEFVHPVVKGKRTKRQRTQPPPLPPPATVADYSSSVSSAEALSGTITEEEEDMANCLILLAQGRTFDAGAKAEKHRDEKFTSRKLGPADAKAGVYVYECKTCNKCFPSFQALGGHRTSHKKPKLAAAEEKKPLPREDMMQLSMTSLTKSIPSTGRAKVHQCSICGSEFSSGQALGGHMRRHRPLAPAESQEAATKIKEKCFPSLDLNVPAPAEDELQRPPSPASLSLPRNRPLIFRASASPLPVDCHY